MIKFLKEIYSALKYGIAPTPYDFYRTVQPLVKMPPCKPPKKELPDWYKDDLLHDLRMRHGFSKIKFNMPVNHYDSFGVQKVKHTLYYGMREIFPEKRDK